MKRQFLMKIVSQVATAPFLVGTSLLLCALTFYYFAVLRIDYSKTALLDLGPHPDTSLRQLDTQVLRSHS